MGLTNMRYDMHKVVIERGRSGSRYTYHNKRPSIGPNPELEPLDNLPKKQGMRRPYGYDCKEFSDLLGPLEGFLISRVGRAWNDVYSEIRERLNPNSTVQIHIIEHVFQFVEIHTFLDEKGQVYSGGRRYSSQHAVAPGEMYVHPETGLLCRIPEAQRWWKRKPKPAPTSKVVGPEKELHKVNGIWYWMVFVDVKPPSTAAYPSGGVYTVNHIGKDIISGKFVEYPGRYRADKRQANRTDLKRYGVSNDG